jgi:hypothetical protein
MLLFRIGVEKRDKESLKFADHALENNHKIQWDDSKIIGREYQNGKQLKVHEAAEMAKREYKTISQPSYMSWIIFGKIYYKVKINKNKTYKKPTKDKLQQELR